MMDTQERDALFSIVSVSGKNVLDIGCGEGTLVRDLARHGAKVMGVDPSIAQLEQAKSYGCVNNETYRIADAVDLPFEDDSFDLVVFLNSLHHVRSEDMLTALHEAVRVLDFNGVLYVSEPLAIGPFFEVCRLIEDESDVRFQAYQALIDLSKSESVAILRMRSFMHQMIFGSFDAFRQGYIQVKQERRLAFERCSAEVRQRFMTRGIKTENGFSFPQPIQVVAFTKIV